MNLNRKIQITIKSRWLFVIAFQGLILVIIFCCFYLLSDYSHLAAWYLKMNDGFYRHGHWKDSFFTPDTKHKGNLFCVLGLIISIPLLFQLIKHLKDPGGLLRVQFSRWNMLMAGLCVLTGTAAWIWGYSLVHQGFDEVFSAVNCASLPPFQTLSYYMLPNNHILFNLLNGTLFHFAGDKVFTGKIISLVCYWGIIVVAFAWLSGLIKNRLLLAMATIVISLQFPVWGFSFQGRGYALCSLAEWSAFFTLLQYINTKISHWLYYYVLAGITGYLCVPVFLYFHAAVLLFGLFRMICTKTPDPKFWIAQLSIISVVFLLYLPAICFSGMNALAGNQYVSAQIHGLQEFYDKGIQMFTGYLGFYTSHFTANHAIDKVLFFLPLTLFGFYRNKPAILCGFFYLALWLSCIALAYIMKIYPIERTMSGHFSISLAFSIYALYLLLSKLNEVLRLSMIADVVLMIILIILGIHFTLGNKSNISYYLYDNDINLKYDLLMQEGINFIPKGSSVGFSDECFYWYYQCKLRGDRVTNCMPGTEQYFVRLGSDPLPISYTNKYVLVKTVFKHRILSVRYEIYKRKRN